MKIDTGLPLSLTLELMFTTWLVRVPSAHVELIVTEGDVAVTGDGAVGLIEHATKGTNSPRITIRVPTRRALEQLCFIARSSPRSS